MAPNSFAARLTWSIPKTVFVHGSVQADKHLLPYRQQRALEGRSSPSFLINCTGPSRARKESSLHQTVSLQPATRLRVSPWHLQSHPMPPAIKPTITTALRLPEPLRLLHTWLHLQLLPPMASNRVTLLQFQLMNHGGLVRTLFGFPELGYSL